MGDVLAFKGRFFAVRDWTTAERAQLQALARDLKAEAAGVEVVYGVSDEGDPWCVIKDADENVLIHVARIGGAVVIHDMVADLVTEGRDLWFALGHGVNDNASAPQNGALEADAVHDRRAAQLTVALVTAAAFGLDPAAAFAPEPSAPVSALQASDAVDAVSTPLPGARTSDLTHDEAPRLAAGVDPADQFEPRTPQAVDAPPERAAAEAVETPRAALAVQDDGPRDAAAAAPAASVAQAPVNLVQGSSGADTLYGTPGADVIRGGAGDDVIFGGGAPTGQVDLIDGGSGNDKIGVDSAVVAEGGSGADTFVVGAPGGSGKADTNLGVIIDFDSLDGDKVTFNTAQKVTITSITPVDNILAAAPGAASLSVAPTPGERVGVDVDGDGIEDGYVLVRAVRGDVALGAPELGGPAPQGAPEHAGVDGDYFTFGGHQLTVGSSIWISADGF